MRFLLQFLAGLSLASWTCYGASAPRPQELIPPSGATNLCPDTLFRINFDSPPTVGHTGEIRITAASGDTVDVIDLSRNNARNAQPRMIGGGSFTNWPVLVSGNSAVIYPHSGALKYNSTYRVSIGPGVFDGFTNQINLSIRTKPIGPPHGSDHLIVAADGSGDFCTVQGAVDFVPAGNTNPTVIFIRKGVYEEIVYVNNKHHLALLGEDRKQTTIQYTNNENFNYRGLSRNVYRQSFGVDADDFVLKNVTVRNLTPKRGSQAEALRIDGRRCIVSDVDFYSLQDTLKLSGTVFINHCYIEGDVDFIWGYGTCFFTNCEIKSLTAGSCVTQIRNDQSHFGDVFVDCRLTKAAGVSNTILSRIEAGRFPYSHVAWINCAMEEHIRPVAWTFTPGINSAETLRFWEYRSTDLTGTNLVSVSQRAAISRQLSDDEAKQMRDAKYVLGGWSPVVPE